LDLPRGADKAAAADDDERHGDEDEGDDAAVKAVESEPAGEPSQLGSRSPTPPPPANTEKQQTSDGNLADHLARCVANGEEVPGVDSDDGLLEGETRKYNVVAAAVGGERAKRKGKVRDDTESDEVASSKGARGAPKTVKGSNKGKGRAEPVSKRKRDEITIEDSDEEAACKSRHKSVDGSKIYSDWECALLAEVRRRFTTLIAARDGFPLRFGATSREINYKLAIQAAKDVMPKQQFTLFKNQMEVAFKDPSRK
jgi:hypothetical protein